MRSRGFTLIELVAVLAIFGIVSIYVGQILVVNERAYHTVEQTSESQQNLRMFAGLIEADLRHTGFMVSLETAACGVDNDQSPDLFYVSDAAAISPQNDFEAYPGARFDNVGNLPVGSNQVLELDSLLIEPSPPNRPAYDTDGDGTPDSDFREDAGVIVADLLDPDRGTACGRVVDVDLANGRITVNAVTALSGAPGTANLVAVPANEYRIAGTELLWNGTALAEGIEDLQVAYIFDLDGDNVVDPGETRGDAGVAAYDSGEFSARALREIRFSLVSRARRPDENFVGRPQAFLNRQPVAATDNFRRRALQSRVRLRNLVSRVDT